MTEQEKWEKVVKGLEICKEDAKLCFGESECWYQSYFPRCWTTLAGDALALLQAQEPVEPQQYEGTCYCGNCGDTINKLDNYCHGCGKSVKWDG